MSNQDHQQLNDRRLACPGFYRMPQAADGGICRIKLELGHVTLQQLSVVADAAETYGNGEIELTTRGNIQLRGVAERNRLALIKILTACGLAPLEEAGDDIRNIMVNPTAGFDRQGCDFALTFAEELSRRLQTSPHYQTLSTKFSFYIDGGEASAILNHKSDIWLSMTEDYRSFAFGIASAPPVDDSTAPALGMVARERGLDAITALLDCLQAAAKQDSSLQRMQHLVNACGREQISGAVRQTITDLRPAVSFRRKTVPGRFDVGIHKTRFPARYYLGIKPPLGRFRPPLLRTIITLARRTLSTTGLKVTPWQSLIFPQCHHHEAKDLARACHDSGLAVDLADAYANIMCCAGAPGCAAALANVQADAHKLAAALRHEARTVIHLVACPKSCTATHAKPVTLLATQPGFYDIYYKDKNTNSKFGRLAAGKVTIDNVTAILAAAFCKGLPQEP